MAPSKRQTTMAKREREQAVKERRARKQERKESRKQAAAGLGPDGELTADGDPGVESEDAPPGQAT